MHSSIYTAIVLFATLFVAVQSAAILSSIDNRCWSDGNGSDQAKWFDDGTDIIRGKYWYQCSNGALRPKGCIGPQGQKLELDQIYVDSGFQFKCIEDTLGYLRFEPSACIDENGIAHQPGETWDNPKYAYWYECQRQFMWEQSYLAVKTRGCLVEGRRFEVGQTLEQGDTFFECQNRHNGTTALCLKGCVHNGQHKKVAETWEEGDYVYECRKFNGTKMTIQCVGCMNQNQRLRSGDRYFKEDSVYTCEVLFNPDKSQTIQRHKIIGCLEKSRQGDTIGERVIGCQWYHDDGNNRYEYRCNEQGKIDTVGCTLLKNGFDYIFVPVNAYTIYQTKNDTSVGIGCKDSGNGNLDMFDFPPEELQIRASGLKYAPPRGK